MQIIRPVTVTNAVLDSSTVPETDYAEWASGTTYATGNKVILVSTHSVYESLISSNTGNNPATDDGTKWLKLGATNRWKAFDQKIADQVVQANSINYVFTPNANVTSIAFFNVSGISVNVTMTDPVDGEVYNKTISLIDTEVVVDWFTYFFEEQAFTDTAQLLDLPPYFGAEISVTITAATGTDAKVGQIVFGALTSLGTTTYGTSISIEDFSRKETDAFGNFIVVQRAFSQLADFDVQFETSDAKRIQRTLADLRATPVVYIGSADPAYGTTLYGFYRRFDLTLETPSLSFGSIEVEGLT